MRSTFFLSFFQTNEHIITPLHKAICIHINDLYAQVNTMKSHRKSDYLTRDKHQHKSATLNLPAAILTSRHPILPTWKNQLQLYCILLNIHIFTKLISPRSLTSVTDISHTNQQSQHGNLLFSIQLILKRHLLGQKQSSPTN